MAVNKEGVPEVLRKVIVTDSGDGTGLVKSGKCRRDAGIRGNMLNPGRGCRDSENSGRHLAGRGQGRCKVPCNA